jgi:hypothetical protein
MARHVWSVLCEKVLVDHTSKLVSLVEVIERINVQEDPEHTISNELAKARATGKRGLNIPVRFTLASWWVRSNYAVAESPTVRVRIQNEAYEELYEKVVALNLGDPNTGGRVLLNFDKMPFTGFGRYWLIVDEPGHDGADWNPATMIPIELALATADASAPGRPSSPPQTSASS